MKTVKNLRWSGKIFRARRLGVVTAAVLVCWLNAARASLADYDAAINADAVAGLAPAATLTSAVILTGAAGSQFYFGAVSGDVTMEFILEGDPAANNTSSLAVGEDTPGENRYSATPLLAKPSSPVLSQTSYRRRLVVSTPTASEEVLLAAGSPSTINSIVTSPETAPK